MPNSEQNIRGRLEGVGDGYKFIATRQNRKSSGKIRVIIPHDNDLFLAGDH